MLLEPGQLGLKSSIGVGWFGLAFVDPFSVHASPSPHNTSFIPPRHEMYSSMMPS